MTPLGNLQGRPLPGKLSPSANVPTQAIPTEGGSPTPVPPTVERSGRPCRLTARAVSMVAGNVYHGLRQLGFEKPEARALAQRAADDVAGEEEEQRYRKFKNPLRHSLETDRARLARIAADLWLRNHFLSDEEPRS